MKGGIGNLMKQAQQLQANMQKAQEEIAAVGELEVEIESRVRQKVDKWKAKLKESQQALEDERNRIEDERINKRAQTYLRDLRRDAVIDYGN